MAKLVSMKISADERAKRMQPTIAEGDAPAYPYGLSVSLDKDALEKLGLSDDLPDVDEDYLLIAKVTVTGVNSAKGGSGYSSQRVELQITDLCLEESGSAKDAAAELYGGDT